MLVRALLSFLSAVVVAEKPRICAYVENWGWGTGGTPALPTKQQLEHVTDIQLAFATTYAGNATTAPCNTQKCTFSADPISWADSRANSLKSSVAYLKQTSGNSPNVLLSFGGWNMGHCVSNDYDSCPANPSGDGFNCWKFCMKSVSSMVADLLSLAKDNGFDGVSIDYEEQNELSSGEKNFLAELTMQLKKAWPAAIISHSIMVDYVSGGYLDVLGNVQDDLDFVDIQFYNSGPSPVHNTSQVVDLYSQVAQAIGTPSKALAGFAVNCGASNPSGPDCNNEKYSVSLQDACKVISAIKKKNSAYGGTMMWQLKSDAQGDWSKAVAGCM